MDSTVRDLLLLKPSFGEGVECPAETVAVDVDVEMHAVEDFSHEIDDDASQPSPHPLRSSEAEGLLTSVHAGIRTLSTNTIEAVAKWVVTLDLSHNSIQSIDFTVHLEHLRTLVLDHNLVSSATDVPFLPRLSTLWLNFNRIDDLQPFAKSIASGLPDLRYLSLMGNKAVPNYAMGGFYHDYLVYRAFMLSNLPKLEFLDDRRVDDDDRKQAEGLFPQPTCRPRGGNGNGMLRLALGMAKDAIAECRSALITHS